MAQRAREFTESMDIYMREISRSNPLTSKEECELSERIKKGDSAALAKLVGANLRFVVKVAGQYLNQGLPIEDLVAVGNAGLITAAKRFEGSKNFKFISYAVWWIRQAILMELAKQSRIVKVPNNEVARLFKYVKTYDKLLKKKQGEVTHEDLAQELNTTAEDVYHLSGLYGRAIELDASPEGDGPSLMDILADPEESDDLDGKYLRKIVHEYIDELPFERDKLIIKEYYGFDGHPKTLEEIAGKLQITRERVRQLKEMAMRKLKEAMPRKLLEIV